MKFFVFQTRMLAENASVFTEAFIGAGSERGEAPLCPSCGDGVGALSWLPPFRVELAAVGTKFGDVAILGGNNLLVSERFRDIYRRNQLKGLGGFEPVEIVRVKRRKKTVGDPPKYLRAAVPYTRTAIDLEASECEWDEPPTCPDCLYGTIRSWKRTIVDESTWTGEDIFIARGLADFIVTQRFKDVCEASHATNIVFVPAEESGRDFYAAGKL